MIAHNWGIFGSQNPSFPQLISGSAGIAAIILVLIIIHLLVVAFIRNSKGVRHTTLGIVQISLGLLIPVTFFLGLAYRSFEIEADMDTEMRFLESPDAFELAVVDHQDTACDKVYVIDWKTLKTGKLIQHTDWDFQLKVMVRYPKAVFGHIMSRKIDSRGNQIHGISASEGYAEQHGIKMFSATGTESDSAPGILVEIIGSDAGSMGTFLLNAGDLLPIPPQYFEVKGKSYTVDLRNRRYYPGFSWNVSPDPTGNGAILRINHPDRKPLTEPIGFSRQVNFNGLKFQLAPRSYHTPVRLDSIRLAVSKNPYGMVFIIVSFLTIMGALIHCSIGLWIQREEEFE